MPAKFTKLKLIEPHDFSNTKIFLIYGIPNYACFAIPQCPVFCLSLAILHSKLLVDGGWS